VALAIFIPISKLGWRTASERGTCSARRWSSSCSARCAARSRNSLLTFVLSRFLQGMGGAMMTPVARLVLVRMTPRNQLVDAMAWLSIPGLVGPIMGPPIGGAITTYLSWHWIFLINIPIGLIGILLINRYLPDWQRSATRRMDFIDSPRRDHFCGWVFGLGATLPALPAVFGYLSLIAGTITAALLRWHFQAD